MSADALRRLASHPAARQQTSCRPPRHSIRRLPIARGNRSCACSKPISARTCSAAASAATCARTPTPMPRPPICGTRSAPRAASTSAPFLRRWTEQAGFPLISVEASCDASGNATCGCRRSVSCYPAARAERRRTGACRCRSVRAAIAPQHVLLQRDGQSINAGRCGDTLSVNADAIGYYRSRYDAATLELDTRGFGQQPVGDQIALLDDQWALARAGAAAAGGIPAPGRRHARLARPARLAAGRPAHSRPSSSTSAARPGTTPLPTTQYRSCGRCSSSSAGIHSPRKAPDLRQLRRTLSPIWASWGDRPVIEEARRRFHGLRVRPARDCSRRAGGGAGNRGAIRRSSHLRAIACALPGRRATRLRSAATSTP